MLRIIAYLLTAVVLISILRSVIGVIAKAAAGLFSPSKPPAPAGSASGSRAGGELKRDPVCGTFVPAANAVKKTIGGEVVFFCSDACRDKHRPAGSA
jgi:YHS domain-containing protein